MVYFNRVSVVAPHQSENLGGCRDVKERKQELLASARPLLAADKTRHVVDPGHVCRWNEWRGCRTLCCRHRLRAERDFSCTGLYGIKSKKLGFREISVYTKRISPFGTINWSTTPRDTTKNQNVA